MWRAIEAELFPQRKKNILIWSWSVAASVAILISLTIVFQLSTKNDLTFNDPVLSENTTVPVQSEESIVGNTEENITQAESTAAIPIEPESNSNNKVYASTKQDDRNNLIPFDEEEKVFESLFARLKPNKAKLEKYWYANVYMEQTPILEFSKKVKRPSDAIGFGSMLAANTPSLKLADMDESAYLRENDDATTSNEMLGGSYDYTSLYDDIEHNAPLSLGLQYSHYITRKINLASGISYTRLSSLGTLSNYKWRTETYSTKHYIGIPINLNYEFLQRRKLALFVSSGLIIEYGLNEKNRVVEFRNGEKIDEYFRNNTIRKPQAGLVLAFGAQYHITNKLDFYLQTGASHYFYLTHYNLWSDQEVWPSLQLGFKIKL